MMTASLDPAEVQYLRLLERCPSPIWVHDGYQILFANRAGTGLVGAYGGELVGRCIADLAHPDALPILLGVEASPARAGLQRPTAVSLVALDRTVVDCRAVVTTIRWRDDTIVEVHFHSESVRLNALDGRFPPGSP